MTEVHACVECASPVDADAPEGLCPNCLLGLTASNSPSPEGGTTPLPGAGFVPPTPAELARRFPGLEILELLGQGGMGAVYKARQPKLDRLVAVKILPPDWGKDKGFADRFQREAKALARLSHPQIVAVHDFGEVDGLFYLVMEYVDGANLRHILREGRLQPQEALAIIPQICDALQYAHEEGVVHRDIKPENILLDSKGRVKIADFGLAKLLNRPRAAFTLTGSQQVMGTLDYMAPEQRLRPQEVDHRADIYSLGVVFYEMLTGELPLGRFEAPSQKARVDARLDQVVFRALEREPERRYQRASQVKMDVESIVTRQPRGNPPAAIPVGRHAPFQPTGDRFAVVGPAAGLILSGVIGCLFWTIISLGLFVSSLNYPGQHSVGYLLMPLLGVPAGLFQIIGGHRLMRCTGYYWAMASAMCAMLPWSPGWLIGLPSGIISLLVLRRPEVQAEFGPIRQQNALIPPAMAIMLCGVLGGVLWLMMGLIGFWESLNHPYTHDGTAILFLLMPLLGCPAACFQVVGAWRMMRAQSYQFCVLSALWAALPWSPAWIISLGFAIWALRLLARRDMQLAFGLPYQSHGGAFERPFELSPLPLPARRPVPKTSSEPERRGLRDFLGSMYSLMFHSRVEQPPKESSLASRPAASPSAVTMAEYPEAIPVAQAANQAPRQPAPRVAPRQERVSTGRTILITLGILFALFVFLAFPFAHDSKSKSAMTAKVTSANLPQTLLAQKYRDLETTLHLNDWGISRDVAEVFRATESEYLQLEARFTKVDDNRGQGRMTVTIGPFPQEVKQLEERFWANLDALLRFTSVNLQDAHKQIPEGSLFPFGKEPIRIELEHINYKYTGKVTYLETPNRQAPRVEEFSGPKLPQMYERFWNAK